MKLPWHAGVALIAVTTILALSFGGGQGARRAHAQTLCPTGVNVATNNGTMSLDSAIAVTGYGCPVGTTISYYVDIPSNAYHPCSDYNGYPQWC